MYKFAKNECRFLCFRIIPWEKNKLGFGTIGLGSHFAEEDLRVVLNH